MKAKKQETKKVNLDNIEKLSSRELDQIKGGGKIGILIPDEADIAVYNSILGTGEGKT